MIQTLGREDFKIQRGAQFWKCKEAVMIQLVQDFKIDDFINKLIDIITKIKSLHVIRRC